jgi:hypothetical protein
MAYCLQSQSFQREILADQQSSSRTLENQSHKLNTIPILTDERTAQLLGYFSYKKGLGGKFGGLEFLANYPEVALANYARTQIKTGKLC